jgi:hypothetical protein
MAASTALAVDRRGSIAGSDTLGMRRVGLVRPTSNPAEVIEAHKEIAAMVAEVLEDGVDYGEIPGTEGKKALFKAGAERLAFSVGASLELEVLEREIDHDREVPWTKTKWTGPKGNRKAIESHGLARGLYRYVVKCRLVRREDGAVLGEGIGSCSTMESKYIDRPRDTENTVLKMAKKRASVDAVLSTLALTGRFAPDEPEDDGTDDDGVVEDPTDGLTLAQALAFQINGVAIGEMRARGVRGDLPQMDRYVRTERGRGYARFLHDFVQHVKQASGGAVPPDVLTQQLDALSADVVRDVYRHPPAA